jgi:N-acyl-D-aspartate/D-glutamate deacylase
MSAKKNEDIAADLAMIEEIFRRYNRSLAVDLHAPLQKKSNNSKVLARLAEIERSIRERAQKQGL